MLRDGFLRFCNDPEIACCKAEAELGRLRTENAQLRSQLQDAQRRERAAVEDINLTAHCDVCKHYDADEISCAKPTVDSYSCFEWRGPQAGKGGCGVIKYNKLLGVDAVYIRDDDVVIVGCPMDGDDAEHNCDEMGCNSVEHILLRGQFRFVEKGYSEATQEAGEESR